MRKNHTETPSRKNTNRLRRRDVLSVLFVEDHRVCVRSYLAGSKCVRVLLKPEAGIISEQHGLDLGARKRCVQFRLKRI